MLQVPVSDRKTNTEANSKTAEPLPEQELPSRLLGGIGNLRQNHPPEHQENLAAFQQAYGNQAALRMVQAQQQKSLAVKPMQGRVLQRKCACGNAASASGTCGECQDKQELSLQTKLRINEPGDEYEQEADRIADEVMRMPEPSIQRQMEPEEEEEEGMVQREIANQITPLVQRQVSPGMEEEVIQTKTADNQAAPSAPIQESSEVPPIVHEVLSSPGQPLDTATRAFFEPRFGHDFGSVRVHTDCRAQTSAKFIHARAFTLGQNIAFGAGEYVAGAGSTRRLLAHELTHVLQQQHVWASTPLEPVVNRSYPGRDITPTALLIQRAEGTDDPESTADESPPSTWTISEQPGAGVIRDPARGFVPARNRQPIPRGTIVSPLDYRDVSGIGYAWVEWPGGIDWVLRSDLLEFDSTYATPRAEDMYRQNVKSFPESNALTAEQIALLERAMKFTDDGSIQAPKELDELGLDVELATRLKTFYQFLVQEDLITDQKFPMSGSRKPWVAHELSTKWMLNKKNNVLGVAANRIEFAKLLVEIGGKDGVTDIIWSNDEQTRKLSESFQGMRYGEADLELALFLISPAATGGWARSLDWDDPRIEAIIDKYKLSDDYKRAFQNLWDFQPWTHTEHFIRASERGLAWDRLAIDLVVAEIRNHFSQKEQKPQEAPALEGYPKGARERYPNIMDVEMTHHLKGDAADIHFPYKFYYFDPIIDAIAEVFGLSRVALKGSHGEYWHYQAVGQPQHNTQKGGAQTAQ